MDFLSFNTILGVSLFVLGFSFIIFVHELGHFLVAKWVGIKVLQFSIGMGQAIFAFRKGLGFRLRSTEPEYLRRLDEGEDPKSMSETEYKIGWMPIGGYVRMLGQEDLAPSATSNDPRSYTSKPVWARMCVISAGVIMNILFGMLFFIYAFMAGVWFPPAVVGTVSTKTEYPAGTTYAVGHENEPAYKGLRPNDRITHVNNAAALDFTDVLLPVALAPENEPVEFTIERDGEAEPLTYRMKPHMGEKGLPAVGIAPPTSLIVPKPADMDDLPYSFQSLLDQGLQPKMKATAVDGQAIEHHHQLVELITARKGQPAQVSFENKDGLVDVMVKARPVLWKNDEPLDIIGIVPAARIEWIQSGSAAEKAQMKIGDVLAKLDTKWWPSAIEVSGIVKNTGKDLPVKVLRNGKIVSLGSIKLIGGKLGIYSAPADEIGGTVSGTPAQQLDLVPGSKIVFINDQPVNNMADIVRILQLLGSEATTVKIKTEVFIADKRDETHSVFLDEKALQKVRQIGWVQPIPLEPLEQLIKADRPIEAAYLGIRKTHQTMVSVYLTLARLIENPKLGKEVRGPLGIADIGIRIAADRERGITYFLFFLGLISVNLAVINFLPIPIVDGGHMVFLIIEKLKGSPVSARVQEAATYLGLALILCIFAVVFYLDVVRLFSGS